MGAEEKLSTLFAKHANDGCGDCICSQYVLSGTFAEHLAEVTSDWLAAHDAATRADERALVLGEVGAETKTEWGVRFGDGDVDYGLTEDDHRAEIVMYRDHIEAGDYEAQDYEPMTIVTRTVTTFTNIVGEWTEADR